jgi:hypothetical protein
MSSWVISLSDDSGWVESVDIQEKVVELTGALIDAAVFPSFGEAKAVLKAVRVLQPELMLELEQIHNAGH